MAKHDEDSAAVGLPAGCGRAREVLIRIRDPGVVLLLEFVAARVGCGIAALRSFEVNRRRAAAASIRGDLLVHRRGRVRCHRGGAGPFAP